MTADEAIAYANEVIEINQSVNGSHFSNAAAAKAAEVAGKLLDVATQLKTVQDAAQNVKSEDEPAADESAQARKRKRGGTDHYEG